MTMEEITTRMLADRCRLGDANRWRICGPSKGESYVLDDCRHPGIPVTAGAGEQWRDGRAFTSC